MSTIEPEIRLLTTAGEPGEILPDVGSIQYMDDSADIGTCTFEYPRDGIRADLVQAGAKCTLLLNQKRIPNGDFTLQEDTENRATDTPGFRTWMGRTGIERLEGMINVNNTIYSTRLDNVSSNEYEFVYAAGDSGPDDFSSVRPGRVMRLLLQDASTRVTVTNRLQYTFSDTNDSAGRPWVSYWSGGVETGKTLMEVAREMARDGVAEARMINGKLALFDLAADANPATVAEFAVGRNMLDGPRENKISDLITALYVKSDYVPADYDTSLGEYDSPAGWVWLPAMVQKWGVIEGYKTAENVRTSGGLMEHGLAFLREQARQKTQNTFGFEPRSEDGTVPYENFGLGDWVSVDVTGTPEPQKIKVITLSWDADRKMSAGLTTNDRFYEYDMARYKRTTIR